MTITRLRQVATVIVLALVACLWFGSDLVRAAAGVLLLIGAWPLWATLRRATEQRGYVNALRWAQRRLEQANEQDGSS